MSKAKATPKWIEEFLRKNPLIVSITEKGIKLEDLLSGSREESDGYVTFKINSVEIVEARHKSRKGFYYGKKSGHFPIYSVTVKNEKHGRIKVHGHDIEFVYEGGKFCPLNPETFELVDPLFPVKRIFGMHKDWGAIFLDQGKQKTGQVGAPLDIESAIPQYITLSYSYYKMVKRKYSYYKMVRRKMKYVDRYYPTEREIVIPLPWLIKIFSDLLRKVKIPSPSKSPLHRENPVKCR